MKIIKIALIAVVTVFTFSAAEAQVRVNATIGSRPVPHRTVVVHRPYHRPVIVTRPVYHHRMVVRRPVYHHRVVVAHRPHYRDHRRY